MLADILREAIFADEQTQDRIIQALAQDADLTIDEVMDTGYKLYFKGPWHLAVRLIVAIGYPRNEQAIKQCIMYISDKRHHSAFFVAVLNAIGVSNVTPYLIQALLDTSYIDPRYTHGIANLSYAHFNDIEGILDYVLPSSIELARQCGPTVAYLLGRVISDPELDGERSFMLAPFQKLGAECAGYALPALIGMIEKWGIEDEDAKEAIKLIRSFPGEILEPYRYLLSFLRE